MRKVKEILRLKWELGLAARQIAHSLSISHSTVLDMLRRAERAGLAWPVPNLDDATLEAALYPGNPEPANKRPEPDMAYIHRELRRKGVTLQLLGGVQAAAPQRSAVQPVLRALPPVGRQAGRGLPPGPPGR